MVNTECSHFASVVIVGAGPVGLALANELGYRGIDYVVIDEGEGDTPFPAGEAIFSRTMEHLRRWGIADSVRYNGKFPADFLLNIGFATSLNGHMLAVFPGLSNATIPEASSGISPEGNALCPKFIFDPALRDGAAAFEHGDLRYHTRLNSFTETSDGVSCEVTDLRSGRTYRIGGRYLAACDGARSVVRKQLGISYTGTFGEGHNFAVSFKAPALGDLIAERFGRRFLQLHTVNTPNRPYFTAVNGHDLWRMSMYIDKDEDPDPTEAVAAAIGAPIAFEVLKAQPWSGHRVVAENYRSNRCFLLGDAAHLRWPKGGFGANTGIGDAVDLGWKIAAVIAGWGGEHLLDSYEAERRPIAVRNVNEAANNRVLDALISPDLRLDEDTHEGQSRRNEMGNAIHAYRFREFRTQGIQLGYRYRKSPICIEDGSLEPPDDHMVYSPSTWPGSRAPHAWLSENVSTLDLFGRGFALLRFDRNVTSEPFARAAEHIKLPLTETTIDDPSIAALYERPLVLVRPDGHVAWRGFSITEGAHDVLNHVRGASPSEKLDHLTISSR